MTQLTEIKKTVPVKQGLYKIPASADRKPALIGCRCPSCGETFFPKRNICQNCQSLNLEEITLSRTGKIYTSTTVMQQPGSYYKGPVPYAFGWVELPEGLRVESLYTGCDPGQLRIGMKVEMILESLHEEGDDQILCHKFRPVQTEQDVAGGHTGR